MWSEVSMCRFWWWHTVKPCIHFLAVVLGQRSFVAFSFKHLRCSEPVNTGRNRYLTNWVYVGLPPRLFRNIRISRDFASQYRYLGSPKWVDLHCRTSLCYGSLDDDVFCFSWRFLQAQYIYPPGCRSKWTETSILTTTQRDHLEVRNGM